MEQKVKFIIIGLIAIVAVSFVINILAFASKQTVIRERDALKEENLAISQKLEAGIKQNQELQKNIGILQQNVNKLAQDREELIKRYELVEQARTQLVDQLSKLKKEMESGGGAAGGSGVSLAGDAYWAKVLKEKKDLEWQLDKLNTELKTAKIDKEQLDKEKKNLELEVANLTREKQDLGRQYEFIQKQVEYNKKMMDTIALELVGEKNDKLQIEESFKTLKNENRLLRRQLKNLNDRKISLERKLVEVQQKNQTLERRFEEMDVMLKDKVLQVDKMNKQHATSRQEQDDPVQLSPIVVRPQSDVSEQFTGPATTGNVVAVNRENNFVIIDIGEDNGIRVGDTFGVTDKTGKPVATLEVIESRSSISACDILKESGVIQVGNKVAIK